VKVIPFPGGGSESGPDKAWLTELEAALNEAGEGPQADSWRELRADVRALAPPMTPEFERELGARIAERSARSAPRRSAPTGSMPKQSGRRWGWSYRPMYLGATAIVVISAVVTLVVLGGPRRGIPVEAGPVPHIPESVFPSVRADESKSASGNASSSGTGAGESASAGATSSAPASNGAAPTPGRVQQLGASIRLAATPGEVQSTADRVSRLAVSDGGFVQSSHVNTGEGAGEANLTLSLPSAKLDAALASLGALAPVRAESQTLQDITNTYDTARQRLSDATAERQALLRALSKATTEGQIDSLRERLAQARGAIAQAHTALQAVSQKGSTSEVEVTVIGDGSASGEGLTVHRGLHDAGKVLVVTLAVLLIAAAVLVPLALLVAALATGRRAWRRYQRERVLDRP